MVSPPIGVRQMIGEPSNVMSITPPQLRKPRRRDSDGIIAIPAVQTSSSTGRLPRWA